MVQLLVTVIVGRGRTRTCSLNFQVQRQNTFPRAGRSAKVQARARKVGLGRRSDNQQKRFLRGRQADQEQVNTVGIRIPDI